MSNWGDDDVDYEANFWHREGCGDIQWLLFAKGDSRDVSAWGVWDGDDHKNILDQVMKGRLHCGMLPRQ